MNSHKRSAFTLIEILVVIALIGVLAGLAIYFVPSFQTSERAARGGTYLQQTLNVARLRAMRDQAPRGLRILLGIPIASAPTGATEVGSTVTITTAAVHGFAVGENVWISNVGIAGYNGIFTITSVPSFTTFTYTNATVGLTPSGGGFASTGARKCQFLEQPDDLGGASFYDVATSQFKRLKLYTADFANKPKEVTISGADFSDGSVQVGDYLEVFGVGVVHRIAMFMSKDTLLLNSDLPADIPLLQATSNFRIIRQPRVTGDEIVDLPAGVIVDGSTNPFYVGAGANIAAGASFLEALPTDTVGNLDIMFSPSGAVMPGSVSMSRIFLWVRSTAEDEQYALPGKYLLGEPTLIAIYANTGLVAAYPINPVNLSTPVKAGDPHPYDVALLK